MISLAFVNGEQQTLIASDPYLLLESAIIKASEEIDREIRSYKNKSDQVIFESEILGDLTEENKVYLEAEKSNIFKTVGDAVISVYEKIKKMILSFIENLKNLGFKNKSNSEKLELLMKEHPDLKEMTMKGFENGDLKVSDANSIKELNKAFNELLELSKKKDVDPKSLKAKWEKAKEKYESIGNTAKTTATIISLAGAAIAFKKYFVDAKKASNDMNKMITENNEAYVKAIKALETLEGGKYGTNNSTLSVAEINKNAYFYMTNQAGKFISNEDKKVTKAGKFFSDIISKYSKKETPDDLKKTNDLNLSILDSKKKEALKDKVDEAKEIRKGQHEVDDDHESAKNTPAKRQAERQKNRQDAADKSYGSEKGKQDFYGKNKQKIDNRTREDSAQRTYGQTQGTLQSRKDYETEIRQNNATDAQDRAYSSEQGKNRFNKDYSKDVAANRRMQSADRLRGEAEFLKKHPEYNKNKPQKRNITKK